MKRFFALVAVVAMTFAAVKADDEVTHYGIFIGSKDAANELTSENVGLPLSDHQNIDLSTIEAIRPYIKKGKVTFGYKESGVRMQSSASTEGLYVSEEYGTYFSLTLENATIETSSGDPALLIQDWFDDYYTIHVELIGENYIKASGTTAIYLNKNDGIYNNIRFCGTGSLNVFGSQGGIFIDDRWRLMVDNVTLNVGIDEFYYGTAIAGTGTLTAHHATLDVDGTTTGTPIQGVWLNMKYCDLEEGLEWNSSQKWVVMAGTTWKADGHVHIYPTVGRYGIKINDVELTEANINNFTAAGFTGKMSIKDDKYLLFENATMKTLEVLFDNDDDESDYYRIYLKGSNTIQNNDEDGNALISHTERGIRFATAEAEGTRTDLTVSAPNGTAFYEALENNRDKQRLAFGRIQDDRFSTPDENDFSLTLRGGKRIFGSINAGKEEDHGYGIFGGVVGLQIVEPLKAYLSSELNAYTTDGETPLTGTILFESATDYGFAVDNLALHSKNLSRLFPSGVTYADGALLLNNATINGTLEVNSDGTIRLKGNNQIIGGEIGLGLHRYLKIEGDGALKIKGDKTGVWMYYSSYLTLQNASVSILSSDIGIQGTNGWNSSLYISNATLLINSTNACIGYLYSEPTLTNAALQTPADAVWEDNTYKVDGEKVTGTLQFGIDYGISIGATKIAPDNAQNFKPTTGTLKGTISYYPNGLPELGSKTDVLVLDNVDYTGTEGIHITSKTCNIYLRGDNRLVATDGNALYQQNATANINPLQAGSAASITLIANGDAVKMTNTSGNNRYFEVNNVTATIKSENGKGIVTSDERVGVQLKGTDFTVTAKQEVIDAPISYTYTTLIQPTNAVIQDNKLIDFLTEQPLKNATVHFAPAVQLSIGGIDISDGGENLQVGQTSGTISYNADKRELTLRNFKATLSEGLVVHSANYDIRVIVEGDNAITSTTGAAIDFVSATTCKMYIEGNNTGKLTLNGATHGVWLHRRGYLYCYRLQDLTISGKRTGIMADEDSNWYGGIYLYSVNATISGGGTESAVKNVSSFGRTLCEYASDVRYATNKGYVYREDDTETMVTDPLVIKQNPYVSVSDGYNSSYLEDYTDANGNVTADFLTSGKMHYDKQNRVITLTNATLNRYSLYIGFPDFTVRLIGKNRLWLEESGKRYGYLQAFYNLTITGDGSLTIETNNSGSVLYAGGTLTIDNANLTLTNTTSSEDGFYTYYAISSIDGIILKGVSIAEAALWADTEEHLNTKVQKPAVSAITYYSGITPYLYYTVTDQDGNKARYVKITNGTTALDDIFEDNSTNLSNPSNNAIKVFQNGHIYILKNGKKYNLLGARVE